ncbi:MAG: L,D-transpeptidase family protein [Boseongicola sp.]
MRPFDMVVSRAGLRFRGRRFPCVLGRGGVTLKKTEGDGATPTGTHKIVGMLYRPDRMPPPAEWAKPILPRDRWCDEPNHSDYNLMVRAPTDASNETLRRADPLYDLIFILDWNWPVAEPGRGSAIFVHRWRRSGFPTAGCVGLRPEHLFWIAARVGRGTRLVVRP